ATGPESSRRPWPRRGAARLRATLGGRCARTRRGRGLPAEEEGPARAGRHPRAAAPPIGPQRPARETSWREARGAHPVQAKASRRNPVHEERAPEGELRGKARSRGARTEDVIEEVLVEKDAMVRID